jgi:hypothetical protein
MTVMYRVGFYETPTKHLVVVYKQVFSMPGYDDNGCYVFQSRIKQASFKKMPTPKIQALFRKCKRTQKLVEGEEGVLAFLHKHVPKRQTDNIELMRDKCFPYLVDEHRQIRVTIANGIQVPNARIVVAAVSNLFDGKRKAREYCLANNVPDGTPFWLYDHSEGIQIKCTWHADERLMRA